MEQVQLADNLFISKLIHGHWRLADWNLTKVETLNLVESSLDLGISTFDHADIYGNYTCEGLFGLAMGEHPALRQKMQIITKCGINLKSDAYPERTVKHYDYSFKHIVASVERSLVELKTDYIDILLLHRPSPFFDPLEVAKAFDYLQESGKVLQFGVSNFNAVQFELLASNIDQRLVTNQIEISPFCIDAFENQTIDFCKLKRIHPMAWSPLAGGKLFNPETEKAKRLHATLTKIGEDLGGNSIDKVMIAWLLKHPSGILPIIGSGKIAHIKSAVDAMKIDMTLEQWFEIYVASAGKNVA